jgi:CelD/BcsL family acetyltransferase involved in cellulose biosynthesis
MIAVEIIGGDGTAGNVAASPRTDISVTARAVAAQQMIGDDALRSAMEGLAKTASAPNPFAEHWYLDAAIGALPEATRVNFAIVTINGRAIGVLPWGIELNYAGMPLRHIRNWLNHNAFLGSPLVLAGYEEAFWAGLFGLADSTESAGLFLHLEGLCIDSALTRALEKVCASQKRRFALVHREERALLEHGLSPEAYLEANMRSKKRKELRRQCNRLAELGSVEFVRGDGSDQLDEWTEEFLVLERRGWKGSNGSALDCSDDTRMLFRAVLAGAAKAGKLELLALRLDGRAIAMLANFITPPGAFSFKTAFDEDFARYSPGVLLQLENLKMLNRSDIAWCDSCAAQDHPMIDSIWSGRRAIGRYSVAIGGRANRAAFAALLTAEKAKARLRKINAAKPQNSHG